MSYLPKDAFAPHPISEDQEFWQYCAQHDLRFQACADCGELRHPPTPMCGNCQSTATEWKAAPQQGVVFTYTVIHHAADERITVALPYIVALIKFPNFGPVKLVSNVICRPDEIRVGMPVRLVWEDGANGIDLPRFVPAK